MKRLFSILILLISLQSLGQTIESAKYNMSIIDSCISKIDTTIKVVQFHFVGDRDPVFQKKLIEAIDAIESVDCLLCDVSPCGCASMKKLRGMSISIYYDSTSCVLNCGSYTSDPETGETTQSVTGEDDSYCWTFKVGEVIEPCKFKGL
jgi:hypothetical protein